MPTRSNDIEHLFGEARQLPPVEREAFLSERCEDEAVRQEVASLLDAHDEATGFFDNLADSLVKPAWEELKRKNRSADPLQLEGERIGRYSVESHLGGGGMGLVYKAQDTLLDRSVALKFLSPYLAATQEAETRFLREARATSTLDHTNIATIYEIGTADAGPSGLSRQFIAMAYYDGETLKARIKRGPLPFEEAVVYAIQIGEALGAAHAAGIVHRDVKPANVIVTEQGPVKLVDFGLAKAAEYSAITNPGRRMGTAAYMSPEQARGEDVDARADLWSLGVVFYEMLTGKRAFHRGNDTATLYAIVHEAPVPLSAYRHGLPSGVGVIVDRCLQKDAVDRYPDASSLCQDLRALQSGEALSASTGTEVEYRNRMSRAVAVLPFETLGTEDTSTFTRGIHGDVLTRLSNVGDLHVISRTSVRRYQNTAKNTYEIGRELDAGWVVEGEVQEAGSQVQVNVRLINARRDRQVWAQDYRRQLTAENLFEIQAEVTKQIVNALKARLTPEEEKRLEEKPTENLIAYRLYAQGRRLLDQRTEVGMRRAVEYFQEAAEKDPGYALAWSGLADALTLRFDYGHEKAEAVLPRAESAVQRALELAPNLAEAHASLGLLHSNRREGPAAIRALERAVELQPGYAEAHNWLSWNHQLLGAAEKAVHSAEKAVEYDPLSPEAVSNLSVSNLEAGRYEQALAEGRRACEIQPEWSTPRFYLALALYHMGRFEEAIALLAGLRATWAGVGPQATLALCYVAAGKEGAARELADSFEEGGHTFATGLLHAAFGQVDRAFEALLRDDSWDDWTVLAAHHFYPDVLRPLRKDQRWKQVMTKVRRDRGLDA